MRIRITILPIKGRVVLPINYNYFLTSLIYRIIQNSSLDYSHFLHNEGYKVDNSKKGFKLFTYSMLIAKKFRVNNDTITFYKGPVHWYISSPIDSFIQHLVTGVFTEGQKIKIGPENDRDNFFIERVETVPIPQIKRVMKFTCLSPITVSKVNHTKNFNGSEDFNCHYLRPSDEGFSEAIKNNLIKKYTIAFGKDIKDSDLIFTLDHEFLERKRGKVTKNINFKGTNIIGFMAPFEASGSTKLIEIGYESGFGEKGSMGFGMVKVAQGSDTGN
ncbi:MAG: CRISPR-associated endoribonuclease Cas6 [bacterium]